MIIYLDIYFLKNMFFNFLLLYLTSFLIRKKTKWYRLLVASFIGGIYAIGALYSESIFQSGILKIIVALIMLIITFGRKKLTNIMSSFFVLTYFIAGFISSILNVQSQIILIVFSISMFISYWYYQKQKKNQNYYEIEAYFLESEINLKAKLDTGNELKDSLFGDAVIVASEESVKKELEEDLLRVLKNERLEIPKQYQNKIRLITFQTISGQGIKIGIQLDRVILYSQKQKIENQAILILTDKNFKGYDALIGPNLIDGAYQYQNN